jgi:hypothetical protein
VPGWAHQTIPKVQRANRFDIVADGGRSVLRVRSSASASTWVSRIDIDPVALPQLHWRWKVSRSLHGSDLRSRQGDDFAARLYLFFDLPSDRLSMRDRLALETARLMSGSEVPSASLCYVWGHAQAIGETAPNAYSDRVRMVVVDSGDRHAGQWRAVRRDIGGDWAETFGGKAPRVSGVAVGGDTDNTGDTVSAWFDDLRFSASTG